MEPSKYEMARALLLQGSLFIHINPRFSAGLLVPDNLRLQDQVVLEFGTALPVPIPDMRVDTAGIFGTLSFRGSSFTCYVPWSSVYGLVNANGMGHVWQEQLPATLRVPTTGAVTPTREGGTLVYLDALRSHLEAARGFTAPRFTKRTYGPAQRPAYLRVV